MSELTFGDLAPDFALSDHDGRMVRLSALAGKPVVIFVYPQDDTETCTAEAVSFSTLAGKFRSAGVRLYGLSPDDPAKHRKFREKHGLKMPLLCDPGHAVIEPWGCWREKELFGRRYMGVIRSTFLVDGVGRLAGVWRGVRVAGHARTVLAAAKALGEGTNPAA
jgi:peroxiredoxin Q/BCP